MSEEKKQQVIALGKLGWALRRIEQATGVRRETAGAYLKAAGIAVRPPGAWGRRAPAKPANGVTPDLADSKPANEVTPDFSLPISPSTGNPDRATSACEPYRELIDQGLRRGRNGKAIYDPTLNPLFRDVLAHYGVVAMPCRIKDPDRKGKVEAGVGHAQKTPLKGQRFESLEEAQAYLDRWEERWADTRIHGTTKRQVAAMFAEEKPSLLPLPLEPFRYYQYGERVVHLDGCVEVEAAYYGLPPGWIGRSVKVQWDALHVCILHPGTNQLLREHIRQKRGWYRIKNEDYPKKMPLSTAQLLRRAGHAGRQIGVLSVAIYQRQGEAGIRRILGILSLAKKYGTAALEDACAAAIEIGVPEYRFVRRYLERRPQLTLRQVDPLIRELTEYRDFINLKLKEQS